MNMITIENVNNVSPILLTVIVLIYLLIVEFGDDEVKRIFKPFLVVLMIFFLILAAQSIISMYLNLK